MLNDISPKHDDRDLDGETIGRRSSSPMHFRSCRLLSRGDCIVDLYDDNGFRMDGMDGPAGRLHVGSIVRLDLPLIGQRNARVLWIQAGQACCRLLVPLTESELRASVGESRPAPPPTVHPVEGGVVEPAEIMRIPTGPTLLPASPVGDRIDRLVILGLTLVLATWVALYILPL
ncbi:hypothetical protein EIK56_17435 [Sphingomonas sp. C8-2]|jgi:hypothetical protein|uniref:PilZ domain-containing protein n=1 Tax=Rhizorhabdus histidinilytica TaxID=439228 RepID=A0A1T5H6W1_9SPHN|nr:hypothetical protein [Rhizorhabdus histidinilytica]QEH79823.1 hypothetical protein EIK56_17435 [Sphingomonas sp. C8-2]SKC16384.1 hypothetical protein SAMN06295920_1482 [Rhizorhabdus histidinilytica]